MFFAILPQGLHWGSLKKANLPPGLDHPCSARTKKSLPILKIFICSTEKLLEKHVLLSYTCIAKCSSFIQYKIFSTSVFKRCSSSSLLHKSYIDIINCLVLIFYRAHDGMTLRTPFPR